jgi:hypothetical protein
MQLANRGNGGNRSGSILFFKVPRRGQGSYKRPQGPSVSEGGGDNYPGILFFKVPRRGLQAGQT